MSLLHRRLLLRPSGALFVGDILLSIMFGPSGAGCWVNRTELIGVFSLQFADYTHPAPRTSHLFLPVSVTLLATHLAGLKPPRTQRFSQDTKVRRQKPVASTQIAGSSRLFFLGHGLVPRSLFSTSLVARPSPLVPNPRTSISSVTVSFLVPPFSSSLIC